jgi:4-hydroxy-tetrahydrodipicolinate reductase
MRILLIGYGKMGKTIEQMALDKGHTISGIIELGNAQQLPQLLKHTDVAIEFTHPESAFDNLLACADAQVPVVCGTTGWLDQYDALVKKVTEKQSALFYASNYSIGVNIFFEINRNLAKLMNDYPQYDITITEIHHTEKKDAPSGTAISIAEGIYDNIDRKESWELTSPNAAKSNRAIPIESIREGMVYGKHTVVYDSPIDQISMTHDAHTRDGFAMGALLAAEWIIGKKGTFGMKDLLGL